MDYTTANAVDRFTRAFADFASSMRHIAKAMEETNRMELSRQKREWLRQTGDAEFVDFNP